MTEPISDEALKALEAGLIGVTLGPWVAHRENIVKCLLWEIATCTSPEDAAHISRCDPQTIGGLIARLRAEEAERDALLEDIKPLKREIERWTELHSDACNERDALRAQVEALRKRLEQLADSIDAAKAAGCVAEWDFALTLPAARDAVSATEPKP